MSGCDNFDFEAPQDEFGFMDGLRGADGTTFYPHVSAEGVLSWTNDGGKPNPDPVNIKGTDGTSAYQAAVEAGFSGTEAEFNEYLSNIGVLTEEVAQQKSALTAVENKVGTPVDTSGFGWESGSYNATTGSPGASSNAIRCTSFPFAIKDSVINIETDESGYSLRVIEMDSATETGATHVLVTHNQVQRVVVQNDSYLRIVLLKTGIGSDTSKAQYVKMHLWSRDNIAYLQSEVSVKAGALVDTAGGAIASFVPDATIGNLLGVSVDIEPVQDLHGLDAPWPGGAKVSKCPTFANGTHTLENGVTITIQDGKITINGTPTAAGYWEESIQPTVIPDDAYITFNNPVASQYVAIGFMRGSRYATAPVPALANRTTSMSEASGQTIDALRISFNSQGSFSNFEMSPIVHLGSTPQPYSQYSNICPISGWDAVQIDRTGKNLLENTATTKTAQGVTFTVNSDGTIDVSGEATGIASLTINDHIDLPHGGQITLSGLADAVNIVWNAFYVYDSAGTRIAALISSGNHQDANDYTFDLSGYPTASYALLTIKRGMNGAVSGTVRPMIRVASDKDPSYVPYSVEAISVQLGHTVYKGMLDVVNGTLAIISAYRKMSDFPSWTYNTNGYFSSGNVQESQFFVIACDTYAVANWEIPAGSRPDFSINTGANGQAQRRLYVRDSAFTTVEDFLAARGDAEVVYTRVTPIVVQLDPVTISTITGQTNSVWADAGDVDVTYAADIKAYIDRMSQPTEDDMIANTLIAANKYFTINNRLFLSTASIAVGAQIIPGTNCTETSLVEALNALNA